MEKETISVIIPVYQAAPYLSRCADSVIGQTYRNLEIIFVDDGSTDRSGDICDSYAKRDSRVIVIHQKTLLSFIRKTEERAAPETRD